MITKDKKLRHYPHGKLTKYGVEVEGSGKVVRKFYHLADKFYMSEKDKDGKFWYDITIEAPKNKLKDAA